MSKVKTGREDSQIVATDLQITHLFCQGAHARVELRERIDTLLIL
jgi:hypothetical protein